MTAHLLALSIGPVQEFIAAARRTRDLWFGSYLLSEISKAAAKAVQESGAKLIFPAPLNPSQLNRDSDLNVANVIVAELHAVEPRPVAKTAEHAAEKRWRSFADEVYDKFPTVIRKNIWDEQVEDVIEFYAAWQVFSPETYERDRAALMRLLAARKSCRDFQPAKGYPGIPKSSLDGARESVLDRSQKWPPDIVRRVRVNEGEQLDSVGMVKRAWTPTGGPVAYPSVARVAADPWLRSVDPSRLSPLIEACDKLGRDIVHRIDTSRNPHYTSFPFDGTVVYPSRYRELQEETNATESDLQVLLDALTPLTRKYGDPSPYLCMLSADGDGMGKAISTLESSDRHRTFSRALSAFADQAHHIVNTHKGVLVYAGGDDVLAFLPVDQCVRCARALRDQFTSTLAAWSQEKTPLSLSVGLAIGHFMEPLEDLLRYGREAEKHAKRPRPENKGQAEKDGLAVHVIKRGGEPVAMRANWITDPDQHLTKLATWLASGGVPHGLAYDFHNIADLYDRWPADSVERAIRSDTLSILKGKTGAHKAEEIADLVRSQVSDADSLRRLADELLVSRQTVTVAAP
ncbi:MAG: type III-B CRISPR-associated protein Cas10/Cmr2 [Bryobacteraceae bacterium]